MPAVLPTLPAYCFLVFFAFYNVLPSVGSQGGLRTPNHPVTFGSCGVAPLYLLIPQPSSLPIEIPGNNLSISTSLLSIHAAIIAELTSQSTCILVPGGGAAPLSHSRMKAGGTLVQPGKLLGDAPVSIRSQALANQGHNLAGSPAPSRHHKICRTHLLVEQDQKLS